MHTLGPIVSAALSAKCCRTSSRTSRVGGQCSDCLYAMRYWLASSVLGKRECSCCHLLAHHHHDHQVGADLVTVLARHIYHYFDILVFDARRARSYHCLARDSSVRCGPRHISNWKSARLESGNCSSAYHLIGERGLGFRNGVVEGCPTDAYQALLRLWLSTMFNVQLEVDSLHIST
jgi:hypothetical protein